MNTGSLFPNIVGSSRAREETRIQMAEAIVSDTDVLITGETGTGKELVAREIHYGSMRKDKPLLSCNCAASDRELMAREIFGHRKGAFAGATQQRRGIFEVVQGGAVILDEIGDMPLDLQLNLLCALEGRKVQRMGEYESRDVDVRVIAISNRDLAEEVEVGRFRGDLYSWLKSFHITMPPLREREDDIPLLAQHFYGEACNQMNKELDGFAPGVIEMLQSYPWPGNVRELRNELYQACVLVQTESHIHARHFSPQILINIH